MAAAVGFMTNIICYGCHASEAGDGSPPQQSLRDIYRIPYVNVDVNRIFILQRIIVKPLILETHHPGYRALRHVATGSSVKLNA